MNSNESQKELARLWEAVAFAARAHRHQVRKDGQTPYVSHVFRVCMVVRHVFGVADTSVLTAAALHDVIEDTTTDFDDVAEQFGRKIAEWTAALSKDKRLAEDERETAYEQTLASAPWQVKVCKLADIYDNLIDALLLPATHRERTLSRARRYLAALERSLEKEAAASFRTVVAMLEQVESQSSPYSEAP